MSLTPSCLVNCSTASRREDGGSDWSCSLPKANISSPTKSLSDCDTYISSVPSNFLLIQLDLNAFVWYGELSLYALVIIIIISSLDGFGILLRSSLKFLYMSCSFFPIEGFQWTMKGCAVILPLISTSIQPLLYNASANEGSRWTEWLSSRYILYCWLLFPIILSIGPTTLEGGSEFALYAPVWRLLKESTEYGLQGVDSALPVAPWPWTRIPELVLGRQPEMKFVYILSHAPGSAYNLPLRTFPPLRNSWLFYLSVRYGEGASGHHPPPPFHITGSMPCLSGNSDADAKCSLETAQLSSSWQPGARRSACSVVSMIPCIAASSCKPRSNWISGYALHQSLSLLHAPSFSATTFCALALFASILCAQRSQFHGFHGTRDH